MAMGDQLTFLGIESSCDDTAAALVRRDADGQPEVLSSIVHGQIELHKDFGGVVPEIAARAHTEKLDQVVAAALKESDVMLADIDAIAVTAGPGLIGGVLSGMMFAKGIAAGTGKPIVGVNHLAGHALTARMTHGIDYPYLNLLVSGGHCQFLKVEGPSGFVRLGGTIDDAPGEAFDKVARLLSLPQPGGPAIEQAAKVGDAGRFNFPRPLLDREDCNLSFSGLKTSVRRTRDKLVESQRGLTEADQADIAAGFQFAVSDVLAQKSKRALQIAGPISALAVAGGVAANKTIRAALQRIADGFGVAFVAPPLRYCTDNAAMIAWAGLEQFQAGHRSDMTLVARPRWPLDNRATSLIGSGKKGPKA